jgi:hypothetical protein
MPTTTRKALRQQLAQYIEGPDFVEHTTTSAGDTPGLTMIDTSLQDLTEDNNGIGFGWVLPTSGTENGNIRRVNAYTDSSTTLTVTRAFSARVATSVTYEYHKFNPVAKNNAINRAIENLYPALYLPLIDETLAIDNILANHDFETYSGGEFTSWSQSGSPTRTQETTIVKHSANSAKLVDVGAAHLLQAPTININEISGKTVTFKCWVYTTDADKARLRINWDDSNFENSPYHTGVDEWQLLKVSASVPDSATKVELRLDINATTAYFDLAICYIDPIYRYTIPTTFIGRPNFVELQDHELNPEGSYLGLKNNEKPEPGRVIRLRGTGVLSTMTSDANTVELGVPHTSLIVAKAAYEYYRIKMGDPRASDEDRKIDLELMDNWDGEVSRLLRNSTHRMPAMAAKMTSNAWEVQETASGRVLVFTVPRR